MAEVAPAVRAPKIANRGFITACVILSVIMQALDTTIANVALPYIQGSVSASADQINWVLTSYIVAAAIMTPPSGFLAARFGRKRVLLTVDRRLRHRVGPLRHVAIAGRDRRVPPDAGPVRRGAGAAVAGHPARHLRRKERGSAMALLGVSVMVGPVLGPVLGGWLTDNISWRWVFYINVPIGALAFAGITLFVVETKTDATAKLDWLGFGALSVSIARCRFSSIAASSSTGSLRAKSLSRRSSAHRPFTSFWSTRSPRSAPS